MKEELTKIILTGDLEDFIIQNGDKRLYDAYIKECGEYNMRINKFYKDLTRRVTNPAYIEMLLDDLYGVKTLYELINIASINDYE